MYLFADLGKLSSLTDPVSRPSCRKKKGHLETVVGWEGGSFFVVEKVLTKTILPYMSTRKVIGPY